MTEPDLVVTSEADMPPMSDDIAAHVRRMQGIAATLAAIGTPEAFEAIEALNAAMDGMSAALQLAAAAMVAATPTEH